MNVINVIVNLEKRTIKQKGVNLTSGDYYSTKVVFEFDQEYEGTKICEIAKKEDRDGNNEAIFAETIVNNEVVLGVLAPILDEHGYIKYEDGSDNIYWYDEENEQLYDNNYDESLVSLATLTMLQEESSIFDEEGKYVLEVSLYENNSKLSSAFTELTVKPGMVSIGNTKASKYISVFDTLMNQANEIISDLEEADTTMTTNEAARQSNETTRQNNETTRQSNETTRQSNESTRQSNESSRTSAETTRISNETSRASAETSRASAETARASAETNRASAESTRASNETSRVSAESSRATAETARASAETSRATAETTRVSNESSRQSAENTRESNETTRQSNESSRSTAETARASAESSRASAETSRASAESTRASNETTRQSNEETRQTNETARETRMAAVESKIEELDKTRGHVYGVKRKISSNTSTSWERILDSVGKVANATKNGETVTNDFDSLAPWADIKSCNYDLSTNKIKAWYGDANFKFDGTNGDVFTYIPKTYWKIYQEDGYDYVLLADYQKSGFTEVDGFFTGRYNGSVVSDVLHSYSGLVPTTNKTRAQFRTLANALGSNFSQLDWRYLVLQMLYLVEYADYDSQTKLGKGIQSRRNLQALAAENDTNRAIVSSSSGYFVGQIIRIGTSDGGTQVANERKITAIEAYSENDVTGYALTFDGAAVNIAIGNYVCTMAQTTGQCDDLGMKSGCLNNDGYHSVIYRGIENLFAQIFQFVDGLNIKDHVAYICKDHSQYADNVFVAPYKALSYTNSETSGYTTELGLDVDEPFFRFPTAVGGGSDKYTADYYYQNTGNRVARVGGSFDDGAICGLWSWYFSNVSSAATWYLGCRVLIDNQ